jgi:predicted phosphate transport protein (TIGR00153 family)
LRLQIICPPLSWPVSQLRVVSRPFLVLTGVAIVTKLERFAQAPFGPLSEHMALVKECVALVEPMIRCVGDHNYDELKKLSDQVFKLEHKADLIKDEIRVAIPKEFSLPVYRGDLLAYLKLQDDMADSVEDVAFVLNIKNLELPPSLAGEVLSYVRSVLGVCEYLFKCTDELAELTERDFYDGKCREILELVAKAERAEWEADKAQFSLAQKLFALDDEMKATDIFLWSNCFQHLGKLANHADKTAERLRRMLAA